MPEQYSEPPLSEEAKDFVERLCNPERYVLYCFRSREDALEHCLIYDRIRDVIVKIEDDRLSQIAEETMKNAGVQVVRDVPPEAGFLWRIRNDLIDAGYHKDVINKIIRELDDMKEAGVSNELIRARLTELRSKYTLE
jgi:hypothetical protein